MQRALLASILVGGLCAVIGSYVVLRGMAFLGDALAHAILPGVAISFILNGDLFLGALIMAIIAAISIGYLTRSGRVREDTAIGIIFSGALALGVVLISSARSYQTDLTHILFGNVLGVGMPSLVRIRLLRCITCLCSRNQIDRNQNVLLEKIGQLRTRSSAVVLGDRVSDVLLILEQTLRSSLRTRIAECYRDDVLARPDNVIGPELSHRGSELGCGSARHR